MPHRRGEHCEPSEEIFMKKVISIIMILVLSISLFSSCKKNDVVYNGSVMLYTTIDEVAAMALKSSFEKEYPGVVLDYYYGDLDGVSGKLDLEFESGQPNADVVFLSSVLTLEDLKSKSRIEAYNSKEGKKIPAQYRDKDNFYYAGAVTTMGIGFNKSQDFGIDEKSAPKSWNDFLSKDFSGKMSLANPNSDDKVKYWVMAMMQNPNYGDNYFRKLKDCGVVIRSDEREVLDSIVGGVSSVGICYDETAAAFTKEFEDFKFQYSNSDNVTMMTGVALVKDAVNPVNGKLLIDYLLSKKGQEVLVANGLVSARSDVKNVLKTKQVISKSLKVDLDDIMQKGNDYITNFYDIFGK